MLCSRGAVRAGDDGGQGQLHREEKEHKPVLKKVKEKVKKIKHTLTGGHSHGHGDEHGQHDDRADYDGSGSDEEEEGDAALEREAAMEKGGYMEDVEDKPVLASEPDPEVHGAPSKCTASLCARLLLFFFSDTPLPIYRRVLCLHGMCVRVAVVAVYESERIPPVQDLVAKYDPQARAPAAREAHGADAPGVRFGNLGGGAVHDPATHGAGAQGGRFGDLGGQAIHAPATHGAGEPGMRFGDLGGQAVHDRATHGVDAPGMRFSDLGGGGAVHDLGKVQEAPREDTPKVRLGDLGGPVVEDPAAPRSKTPAARGTDHTT